MPLSKTIHLTIVSLIIWNVFIENKYNEIAFFKVVGYNPSLLQIIWCYHRGHDVSFDYYLQNLTLLFDSLVAFNVTDFFFTKFNMHFTYSE